MAGNKNLHAANKAKNDEFYTQLVDIENELKHYRAHFQGKTIFCNCDDPYESNFFKYFAMNFNQLGLKKLIATCFDGSPIAGNQLQIFYDDEKEQSKRVAYKIVITEVTDVNGDGAVNLADVEWLIKNDKNVLTRLEGNGDFRSQECIELLKEADIVVTNPPFSLFREYLGQLIEYGKQFLIIGNQNAITYKEVFKLIKENAVWWGYGDCVRWFIMPKKTNKVTKNNDRGEKVAEGARSRWFTNLDHSKRHENLDLYKHYTPEEYPHYDNYDAINVDKTADIPMDYDGVMGVPITFLDKYNPEQFEIIDINPHFFTLVEQGLPKLKQLTLKNVGKKDPYARILIRKRK